MTRPVLYMAPFTCARVTAIALLEAGVDFDVEPIRFMTGQHKSEAYRAVNPLGKVPALAIDGEVLTENVAILTYLAERFPEAGLLPEAPDAAARARTLADLAFCAATLHPLVTRIRLPAMIGGRDAAPVVKAMAETAMDEYFAVVEARLEAGPWWYGNRWSAMDGYLFWVFWRVAGAGYDTAAFPRFTDHARRIEQRPAVAKALAIEADVQRKLELEGTAFVPPTVEAEKNAGGD